MPNIRALEAIVTIPINVGPFTQSTTGAIVPFFNDSRALYSHPEVFRVFTEELANTVRRHDDTDIIIGVPMAGIPLATALAIELKLPIGYLNKERKPTLRKKLVEGDYAKGARALLVDDVIGLGGTLRTAIDHAAEDGIVVTHVATMWNPWWPKNQPFLDELNVRSISFDTLYTRVEWMDYLLKKGAASPEMKEIHDAYLADPVHWHEDSTMWQKFLDWKKHAHNQT